MMNDGLGGIECIVEGLPGGASPQRNGRMCVPWGDYAAPSIHLLRPSTHSNMGNWHAITSTTPRQLPLDVGEGCFLCFESHMANGTTTPLVLSLPMLLSCGQEYIDRRRRYDL